MQKKRLGKKEDVWRNEEKDRGLKEKKLVSFQSGCFNVLVAGDGSTSFLEQRAWEALNLQTAKEKNQRKALSTEKMERTTAIEVEVWWKPKDHVEWKMMHEPKQFSPRKKEYIP